jgi:hypothetical protein
MAAQSEEAPVPATSTLLPIDLDPGELAQLDFPRFCESLLAKLSEIMAQRFDWYDGKRRDQARWVNGSRYVLAILGSVAILLTAIGATMRIAKSSSEYDLWALVVALVLYAIMGAVSFFEKTTDSTSAYFRYVGVILAIRDLWTKLQFELLKELLAFNPGGAEAEAASRGRLCTLAEAFCRDLDKLASVELNEWRVEVLASWSKLEDAAKQGTEGTQKQLLDAVKAIEKSSADKLNAAEEAAKPAFMNVRIEGDFDRQVAIFVDDVQVAVTHLKSFPIDKVRPGFRKIEARAKKGDLDVQAAKIQEINSGPPEDVVLALA